jgi:hypothetical protein
VVEKTEENLGKFVSELDYVTASGRNKEWGFTVSLMSF